MQVAFDPSLDEDVNNGKKKNEMQNFVEVKDDLRSIYRFLQVMFTPVGDNAVLDILRVRYKTNSIPDEML